MEAALRNIEGVLEVHDLHVWTITSGLDSMSGHLVVAEGTDEQEVLVAVREMLHETFGIGHVAIQIETPSTLSGEIAAPV